jgi:hypothetical protein
MTLPLPINNQIILIQPGTMGAKDWTGSPVPYQLTFAPCPHSGKDH